MRKERNSFYSAFNTEFEKQLPVNPNYQSAFNAAANNFEEKVGASPYKSFNSFKVQRSKRRLK
jgi:hypothetical protein